MSEEQQKIDQNQGDILYMAEELYKNWIFHNNNLWVTPVKELKADLCTMRNLAFLAATIFYEGKK